MAAHRLVPKDFEDDDELFLSPSEVIQRLRNEFAVVETDKEMARSMVQERIDYIKQQAAVGHDPWLENDETLDRLRLGIDNARYVYFADDADAKDTFLTTVVMPNEPLFFGYSTLAHQEKSRVLLERAAAALGYDIEY